MKLRRNSDKSALMLMTNTVLFGTGAGLVVLAWRKAVSERGVNDDLFRAVMNLEEPLLLITVAILLGGVFHSFTILYPLLLEARRERLKALSEVDDYRDQAHRDPLTNLHNRRYFDEVFQAYFDEFHRMKLPFALFVIDADRFKRVNDTFGHAGGDEVLRKVADCLSGMVRENDIVARIGGEEFAIILTGINHTFVDVFAERVRKAVADLHVKHDNKIIRPTISVGAVLSSDYHDAQDMMRQADNCLYKAKERGRNQTVSQIVKLVA